MAFIDWLRKQHEESARNKALFEGRPRVAASQAWGGYRDPNPQSRLMVRQPSPTSVTLTEKDDGSTQKVTKWEPDKQEKRLKATALPSSGQPLSGVPVASPPHFDRDRFRTRGMGGFTGGASMYDMARDPGWAGVPRARAAPLPRRVQPRSAISPEAQAAIAQVQAIGGQNVDAYGDPVGVDVSNQRAMYHALRRPNPQVAHIPSIRGNIGATQSIGVPNQNPRMRGMPSVLRQPALTAQQQAAIPRQQMPPPRFVPRVDPSQFPRVQDRGLGTYDIGEPGVRMGGGFDWTGKALRENIGEDWRNIGERYTNWWQNLVEENRRKRQRGNY